MKRRVANTHYNLSELAHHSEKCVKTQGAMLNCREFIQCDRRGCSLRCIRVYSHSLDGIAPRVGWFTEWRLTGYERKREFSLLFLDIFHFVAFTNS